MPNQARMGGGRQTASKLAHSEFLENPEIQAFLDQCDYMREPTDAERTAIRAQFIAAPTGSRQPPTIVIAVDGSPCESDFHGGLPNTRAGYIKVSGVAVNVPKYQAATDKSQRYVDPFAMAAIYDGKNALTLCLPSSNVRYGNAPTVKHGFRRKLFEEFSSERTRIPGSLPTFLDTLFRLAELTPVAHTAGRSGSEVDRIDRRPPKGGVLPDGSRFVTVHRCPWCGGCPQGGFRVPQQSGSLTCNEVLGSEGCDGTIYGTDALRVYESVTSQGANLESITRTMNVVEMVFLTHLILYLVENNPEVLSRTCFVVDGPLAMFGEAAWMHGGMLRLYHWAQERLRSLGLPPFLLFGIQKGGQLSDHGNMLRPHMLDRGQGRQEELILAVSDEYRNEFIREREDSGGNFGDETYWGQDFLFRASNGDMFVIGVPYPTPTKRVPDLSGHKSEEAYFRELKAQLDRYLDLGDVLNVVRLLRSDLYESSIVPILAAHQDASISLVRGGRVLDPLTHLSFARGRAGPVG